MNEPEPTIAGYLPEPPDERADELEILKNENMYLKTCLWARKKFEKLVDVKVKKAKIKKQRRDKREKN